MLVSHEVPICLLKESQHFNDYDYCLAHLYVKYPEYRDFYLNHTLTRHVLLDNSAYELRNGDYFDSETYFNIINELKPTEYIIPDVFNNTIANVHEYESWMKDYGYKIDPNIRRIGVIHGSNYKFMESNFDLFNEDYNIDKIAINFAESPYDSLHLSDNESLNKSYNRMSFIFDLFRKYKVKKPIHLLGCSVPQEFQYYKQFDFIETIDTSNPIMAGYDDMLYDDFGLYDKPKTSIDSIITKKLNDEQYYNIMINIRKFKKFIS